MRTAVTYLLLAATIAKVITVLALGPASIEMDAKGYWHLSDLALSGDILMIGEPIGYRTPLYPWFLALVRLVFADGSLIAISGIQGAMLVASFWIAGKIAGELTQSDWAMPLTLGVAIPTLSAVTYAATMLSESLFTFCLMLNLWSLLIYLRTPNWGRASWVGVTFALALLTRPVVMYLWVAHLVLVLRRPLPTRFAHVGIATLVVMILVSPWLLRNQQLFGRPFVTEFLGRNIWITTFQSGSGAGLDLAASAATEDLKRRLQEGGATQQWRETWSVSAALVTSGLSDPEADRLMRQVAIDAIKADPGPFVYKAIRRTANFWRCAVTDLPIQGQEHGQYQGQRSWSFDLSPVNWAIENRFSRFVWINTLITTLVGIAVIILIVHRETRRSGIWLGLIFSYFALVTGLVEIPNYRYRMVLEPLAAATIGGAIAMIAGDRLATKTHDRDSIQPTDANG